MCPPGVDQTTRVPQCWQVLAPEKRQALPYQESYYTGHDDAAHAKFQEELWSLIARPAVNVAPGSGLPQSSSHISSGGCFGMLSNEIFDMIFCHLQECVDIIAFGLTSTTIWRLMLHHVQAEYVAAAAPWANSRLVFQGSYSEDLPQALTDDGDLVKTLVTLSPFQRGYDRRAVGRIFYGAVVASVRDSSPYEMAKGYVAALQARRATSGVGALQWEVLKKDLGYPESEKAENEWVLRNLTTREIVFSAAAEKEDPEAQLELILLLQITWTSMLEGYTEDLSRYRGKWAGHRFEIVTVGAHEKDGGEWKDVTIELAKSSKNWKSSLAF